MKTSISFLKSNLERKETINKLMQTDTDYIHVDIMDGEFVENRVLEIKEVLDLLNNSIKPLDIHLMVSHPLEYLSTLNNLNVKYFTIHAEINENIDGLINLIHSYGINAGIAINPETGVDKIKPYLDHIEYVIIMGVNPGAGGQAFKPEVLEKVDELIELRNSYNYHYEITIDGGVNEETRKLMDNLDVIISGSYVCMSDNYQERINTLR